MKESMISVHGLFGIGSEVEMPCAPSEIRIWRWALPNTLGRAEREEAAARILHFSQMAGEWVGVSWLQIVEQIRNEQEAVARVERARAHNVMESLRVQEEQRWHVFLTIVTLGLYALFARWPQPDFVAMPEFTPPMSVVPIYGPSSVVDGVRELLRFGLLRCESRKCEGPDRTWEDIDVLFPTPDLVKTVMQAQAA